MKRGWVARSMGWAGRFVEQRGPGSGIAGRASGQQGPSCSDSTRPDSITAVAVPRVGRIVWEMYRGSGWSWLRRRVVEEVERRNQAVQRERPTAGTLLEEEDDHELGGTEECPSLE